MEGEITIRSAEEADLPAIVEIFNAAVATRMATAVLGPVTLDERREWFHEHLPDRHPLFVFVIDDRVAGWLSVHPFMTRCAYAGTAEVSVYVHPQYKRRGVGHPATPSSSDRSAASGVDGARRADLRSQ